MQIYGFWYSALCLSITNLVANTTIFGLNPLQNQSTTSITRSENPATLKENMDVAARGGKVARVAREELEAQTGKKVVSPLSAKRFFKGQKPTLPFEEDKDKDE